MTTDRAEPQQPSASDAYDRIDRFLRNNLDDADYAQYSEALEIVFNDTSPAPTPVSVLLFCPCCNVQHIDAPQPEKGWTNPPHRSHECQACGHVWRPADVATTGVPSIATKGSRDGTAPPAPDTAQEAAPVALRDALISCARMFRMYVDIHAKKGDEAKAARNREMVELCDRALASPPAAPVAKQINEDDYVDIPSHDSFDPPPIARSAADDLQSRVAPWMQECFGPVIAADRLERSDRFIEESLELVQACDYPKDRAHALVEYVYGRPLGHPPQEVGGVMVTLAALCLAHGMDMHAEGSREVDRISAPEIIAKIRAKQASKPTGSALPIAAPVGSQHSGSGEAPVSDARGRFRADYSDAQLANYLDAYCGYDPKSQFHAAVHEAARRLALAAQNSPAASGVAELLSELRRIGGLGVFDGYEEGPNGDHYWAIKFSWYVGDAALAASSDTQARDNMPNTKVDPTNDRAT